MDLLYTGLIVSLIQLQVLLVVGTMPVSLVCSSYLCSYVPRFTDACIAFGCAEIVAITGLWQYWFVTMSSNTTFVRMPSSFQVPRHIRSHMGVLLSNNILRPECVCCKAVRRGMCCTILSAAFIITSLLFRPNSTLRLVKSSWSSVSFSLLSLQCLEGILHSAFII